jgi:hypothetical protein
MFIVVCRPEHTAGVELLVIIVVVSLPVRVSYNLTSNLISTVLVYDLHQALN